MAITMVGRIRTLGNQPADDATAQVILDLILGDADGHQPGNNDQDRSDQAADDATAQVILEPLFPCRRHSQPTDFEIARSVCAQEWKQ